MNTWNSQYKTLNHWRGLAALWVMLFHGFGTSYEESLHPIVEALRSIAEPGWLGVHLFFVISGYCIAASSYRLILKKDSAFSFLKDRSLRLFPTYWCSFLVTLILNLISSPFNQSDFWAQFPSSLKAWIGNIFLIQPYVEVPYYVVVYWSLVVEVGFYVIVAFLILLQICVSQMVAISTALGLGVLSIFIVSNPRILFFSNWGEFLCGALVFYALLWQSKGLINRRSICLLVIVVLMILGFWINLSFKIGNHLWFSAPFAIGLYFLYDLDTKMAKITWLRWLEYAGVMSYSLYLLHVPFQGRVINLGLRLITADSILFLPLQILGWIMALGVSYLFYRLIEQPLNDWRYQLRKPVNQAVN
ncbi:MAG: acyltransferase family protein [Microcoleaceae cyanobacterium]